MNDADLALVRLGAQTKTHRVATVVTSEGSVVVKTQRARRSAWRRWLGNGLAGAAGLAFLQSPSQGSGDEAQAIEVARLRALHAAGVAVPRVLLVEPTFFAMTHVTGASLIDVIEHDPASALTSWQRGLQTLLDVHSRGQYLSQAFARNFIVGEGGLAMIDFEDDPGAVISIEAAQARDWLAYLHSTAWRLRFAGPLVAETFGRHLQLERPAVRDLVEDAGRRVAWMRHLPRTRRPFGREVVGLQALAALLERRSAATPRGT